MGGAPPPSQGPAPPSADELEQQRRLTLIRNNQRGRTATLLTPAIDTGGEVQSLLGAGTG